jgi:RimJ/RimL family protein N-acetyltransferase
VILLGQDERLARWVQDRVSYAKHGFGPCVTIGRADTHGHVLGAFVFHEYRSAYRSIQMSFAGEAGWLSRGFLRFVWRYPFEQMQVRRVYGCIAATNAKARETARRIGGTEEAVLRLGFGDDDLVIYRVLKEECKWLS